MIHNDLPKFLQNPNRKAIDEIPMANLPAEITYLPVFMKALNAQVVPSGFNFWPDDNVRVAIINLSAEVLDFPRLMLPHSLVEAHVIFIIEDSFSAGDCAQKTAIVDWCNDQKILSLVLQANETKIQALLNDFNSMFGNMGETAICAMVDFADIFELLSSSFLGARLIAGVGKSGGDNRVETATTHALAHIKLKCCKGQIQGVVAIVAFNRKKAKLNEASDAMILVRKFLPAECGFIYSLIYATDLDADEMRVTVLAAVVDN